MVYHTEGTVLLLQAPTDYYSKAESPGTGRGTRRAEKKVYNRIANRYLHTKAES